MEGKVKCTCGWSWNKSDSSKKDMYICHECGRDNSNNMKNGGNIPQAQEGEKILSSRERRGNELLLKETEKANKDKQELVSTGQIKNPRSIQNKKDKKELEKKQTSVKQDTRSEYIKKLDQEKGQAIEDKKQLKKNIIAPLDVATDIMQLGNFVPHPIGQTIGKIGNIAGAGIDAYQAADDFSEGNYGSGTLNALSAVAPMFIENAGYTRNMYNTNPGSLADDIASLGNRSGNYVPLTLLPRAVAPSTIAGVNYNRALLGTLGAETIYDASSMFSDPEVTPTINTDKTIEYYNTDPKRGDVEKPGQSSNVQYVPISNSAELKQWKQQKSKFSEEPINFPKGKDIYAFEGKKGMLAKNGGWLDNYNDSKASAPEGMVGDGFSNVGRNYSPAWGGSFQMGGSVYPVNYVPQAQEGKKLNPFTYPKPDYQYRTNPFLVRDPQHDIFVGGVNPTYSTEDFSIGASAVGVGNKDFQKLPADYGIRGSYNPSENFSINANLSKNNVGAGMSYRFENGGEVAQNGQEMQYYREGLDFQPKTISKNGGWLDSYEDGGIVRGDQEGYRNPANRGKDVEILGDTMGTDGYGNIPLYVVPDVGEPRVVNANTGNHTFPGATKFTEYPIAQGGYTTGDNVKYGTPEYEEAYSRGEVVTEDEQYSPIELEEVVVQGRPLTEFGKTRKEITEKNTWEQFANDRYLGNFEKNMGQTLQNLPEYRKQEYEDYVNKLAFDEYVKTHPQAKDEKRGAYIDRIQKANANSSNFEKAYEANAEYNPSTDVNLWRKGLMGLGSLAMGTPAINKLKQKSDYYSTKEKQYIDEHPVASAFDTTLGTLAPLEIPGNMLSGQNNTALEALSGRPSDVPIEARLLGDPLMMIGEAAPLIGKGMGYLGNKGSQALAKVNEVATPSINKAKTLVDDMASVMLREVKTIDPKINAISDAESAIYQTPEYSQFQSDYYALNKQKWALEGKVNKLKTKGQTAELINLNDKIDKLNKRIEVAGQFKVNNEGLVQSGKDTALGLRTGSTDIMDLSTGEKFPISTSVPNEGIVHRLEGDKVVKSIDNSTLPQSSPEYNATVKKNIDFIETQIPGAKIFGSAKNVADAELPHIIGDYDVLMSQTQYNKFAKANPSVGKSGLAELHNIPGAAKGVKPIDINIIQEKGGKAIGTRAEELFKQVAPDKYYAAVKNSIKNKSEIKIPYSSQELVDMTNPTTKSVIDAYESSKAKHVNKIDALINYGKPSVVAEGQQQFVNSLVGSKGSIGHQFPLEQLSNAETNAEILDKIGFIGNKKLVAADPQRMQIAINDYYMNNSILARQVDKGKINKIEAAIKEYYPGAGGGNVNGIGQNHVLLGHPFHGDNNIISMKQVGMNLDTTDPLSYINSIDHQISGEKLFSEEERNILANIVKNIKIPKDALSSNNIPITEDLIKGSENSSQLIENLPYSEEGKKALYEFGKQTNRTMAKKAREYGNSTFVATLRDFDDAIDAMQYQLVNFEYTKNPVKSFKQRTQAAEHALLNQANISTDLELLPKQFKAIKGYVEGGMDKANERLVVLNAERTKIGDDITDLSNKVYNKKYKDEIDRLKSFQATLNKEIDDMSQMRRDLYARKIHLNKLEEKMKTVGILGGGFGTLIGLGVGHSKLDDHYEKRNKEYQKEIIKKMAKEERKVYQQKMDSIQQREDRPFLDKSYDWFMGKKENGGIITKAKNGNQLVKLDQLTNFTNYNKPQPGGWLNKYN
jgi:hypothetical protein